MKTEAEIIKAHDRLVGVLLGDCPPVVLEGERKESVAAAANALCWILEHNHNTWFADTLATIEKACTDAGYILTDTEGGDDAG